MVQSFKTFFIKVNWKDLGMAVMEDIVGLIAVLLG